MKKIQLIIFSKDEDYVNHLSYVISKKQGDLFETAVCSSEYRLSELVENKKYDIGLIDGITATAIPEDRMALVIHLWNGEEGSEDSTCIKKYQRISSLTSQMLELYADLSVSTANIKGGGGHITVVWSPIGGAGTTTVSLAYGTNLSRRGKKTAYLSFEPFTSSELYFQKGKSISNVFEKLGGNLDLILKSAWQQDQNSGLLYLGVPNNYDDINILTEEEMCTLVLGCASGSEEVVVDLGNLCDGKRQALIALADRVFVVSDGSRRGQIKLNQFFTQHDTYDRCREKLVLVSNFGSSAGRLEDVRVITLPKISSENPVTVYRDLADSDFGF